MLSCRTIKCYWLFLKRAELLNMCPEMFCFRNLNWRHWILKWRQIRLKVSRHFSGPIILNGQWGGSDGRDTSYWLMMGNTSRSAHAVARARPLWEKRRVKHPIWPPRNDCIGLLGMRHTCLNKWVVSLNKQEDYLHTPSTHQSKQTLPVPASDST